MVTNASEFLYESLRISYEAYDQSAVFRVNPLRMLRQLTNVLRSLQMRMLTNIYECLAITLRSLRIDGELHS